MGLSSLFKKKITDEWKKDSANKPFMSMPSPAVGRYEGEISENTVKILFVPDSVDKIGDRSIIAKGTVKIGSIDKETGFYVLKPDGSLAYTLCKAFAIDNQEVDSVKSGDNCILLLDPKTKVDIEAGDKIVEFISPDLPDIDDLVMPDEFKKFRG